jgi:hypothetical protein
MNKNVQKKQGRKAPRKQKDSIGHPGAKSIQLNKGNNKVMAFRRTVAQNVPLTQATGFGGVARDMQVTVSLSNAFIFLGGILVYTVPFPNATEFSALFAEYRIKQCSIRPYYNNNNSSISSATLLSLPLITVVFDPSDSATCLLTDVLQYPNARTYQLGNGAEEPPCFTWKPIVPITSGVIGGLASNAAILASDQWINTDLPNVQHFGMKLVYDPSNTAVATAIGSINFYIDIDFEMRVVN